MAPGVLLDTHALYWLVSGAEALSQAALAAVGQAQKTSTLYVSAISAWELSLAVRKPNNPPQLGSISAATWFRAAMRETGAKIVAVNQRIALAAADVVEAKGHKDPGDCYIIATARVRKIPIISRDRVMFRLMATGYVSVIEC